MIEALNEAFDHTLSAPPPPAATECNMEFARKTCAKAAGVGMPAGRVVIGRAVNEGEEEGAAAANEGAPAVIVVVAANGKDMGNPRGNEGVRPGGGIAPIAPTAPIAPAVAPPPPPGTPPGKPPVGPPDAQCTAAGAS